MLHPDRYFSPVPAVRELAAAIYETTRDLPLVCPHGHVDARLLLDDAPFPEPTTLLIRPDHYLLRMLYSQGVPLEKLGIQPTAGNDVTVLSPREAWQTFADNYHLFLGTPSRAWLEYEMAEILGVSQRLTPGSAMDVYDEISEQLARPEFRPRALFERFQVEVLCTTDGASDSLEAHARLQTEGFRVLPTFRPDALFEIARYGWVDALDALSEATGMEISSVGSFVRALESRREYFWAHGATATDHGVESPQTGRMSTAEADRVFESALAGRATQEDEARFQAHMLMEMARMSAEDGLVMQLHAGVFRHHNPAFSDRFGPDRGDDIPLQAEFTRALRPLLNEYGNDPRFRLVLFTLDESTYSRELAPIAGHYPSVRLGPAWWFLDSFEGMMRYRRLVTETAGFHNTAGFNDDTRAFLSIPARHDLSRRVDANFLAELVARHEFGMREAMELAQDLAGDLARDTYSL